MYTAVSLFFGVRCGRSLLRLGSIISTQTRPAPLSIAKIPLRGTNLVAAASHKFLVLRFYFQRRTAHSKKSP